MDQIGVNIGICLGNSHDNFQLHKREYSKSFRGGYFFDSHCTSSLWSSVQLSYLVLVLLWIIIILVTFTKGLCSTEHLDVCPLATSCKNYWSDGSSQRDESVDKEELIKFWKSSTSGFGSRNCLRILHHCNMGHFSTICLLSLDKLFGTLGKFYHRYNFGQGRPR